MKKREKNEALASFISDLILDIVVFTLIDVFLVIINKPMKFYPLVASAVILTVFIAGKKIPHFDAKARLKAAGVVFCIGAVLITGFFGGMTLCGKSFEYKNKEEGKEQLFSDKSVMLIVPHPDDDINVLAGVCEEFVKYSSDVRVVFLTNGDIKPKLGEKRIKEVLKVYKLIGIPENNIIFLGYADTWLKGEPHIYNVEGDKVCTSTLGKTKTYGIKGHPAYNDGNDFTHNNIVGDMKSVILEYKPDIIFCNDYDSQEDHRANSMFFEKAMGQLLFENQEYRPYVFKGYAYSTAFNAVPDFYEENIKSTLNPFSDAPDEIYNWDKRVRLPVDTEGLSRSLLQSRIYKETNLHFSQNINEHAVRIINGDKVFWQRSTASLCYGADIEVSSNSSKEYALSDFMLLDNDDLLNKEHFPYDGVWSPDKTDSKKTVSVKLKEESDIYSIALYDSPSLESNILNAVITFDDGSSINTGALNKNGAVTEIPVNKKDVTSFIIAITDTEGESCGLCEIEAYKEECKSPFEFIKLTDSEGNFVYDYFTDTSGKTQFKIYNSTALKNNEFQLLCDNKNCTAKLENGVISVICPYKEHCSLKITDTESGLTDSAYVSNPSVLKRKLLKLMQSFEPSVVKGMINLSIYRCIFDILELIY